VSARDNLKKRNARPKSNQNNARRSPLIENINAYITGFRA